jgi:fluoroquinolone resistance protein
MQPEADSNVGFAVLRHADFRGRNLLNACFTCVDVTGADFRDCRLDGASFRHVMASNALFDGATCEDAFFEQVDLAGATLRSAALRGTVFKETSLVQARLDAADLTDTKFLHCQAEGVSLRGALLAGAITPGSSFEDADLTDARRFTRCRELVVEVLRREAGNDPLHFQLLGALAIKRDWCYAEWSNVLSSFPQCQDVVLQVFGRFPHSGLMEALRSASSSTEAPRQC